LTIKFTQLTPALRQVRAKLLLRCCLLIASTVIADHGNTSRSKALIKNHSYYSPCSYPMLFSCQISSALRRPTWVGKQPSAASC